MQRMYTYLVLFAEVDSDVDGRVVSESSRSGDPAGSVGRVVEVGQ